MQTNQSMSTTAIFATPTSPIYKGVRATSHYLTMPDGVQIAIDVLLPANADNQRLPTLMIMARYWRSMELRVPNPPNQAPIGPREPIVDFLIPRGYALVVVDGRGTGASTGVHRYPWSPEELADYATVAQWASEQAWCSGNIGTFGISYEGGTALRLASQGVPAVKAVMPQEIEFDVYTDIAIPGGIFNLQFIQAWSDSNNKLDNSQPSRLFPWSARLLVKGVRPVDADRETRTLLKQALHDHQANTDVYHAMTSITYRDDHFGTTGATLDDFSVFPLCDDIHASDVPIFSWASWLDGASADALLKTYNTLSNPQIGIIGAWKHEMTAHGSPYQKPSAKPNPAHADQWATLERFFQQVLVQDKPVTDKTLYYYTLGAEAWKQTDVFPLPNTQMEAWYFQANRALAPQMPPADTGEDTYTVDFQAGTGTTNRWNTQMAQPLVYTNRAKADQRLLTYTSAPMAHDTEITGYPIVHLYVASSVVDNAFFVYLEDVSPQGEVRYITEGQLRGMHRQLSTDVAPYWSGMPYRTFKRADASPMPVGTTVELTFGLQPTSVLIRQGHSIRVAIAGADKDSFARIPAEGTPTWTISRNRVFASRIELPMIR